MLLELAAIVASINIPIPEQYKGPATVTVRMVASYQEVELWCGKASPKMTRLGCLDDYGAIVIVNPCKNDKDMQDKDSVGYLLCHEKAHVNGWRH